jgi:glucan 1,3-beta-glucosidase
MGFSRAVCTLTAALSAVLPFVSAAPTTLRPRSDLETRQSSSYWMESIKRQGTAWGNDNIKIFRNVKDYGAKGDGSTDDTDAINKAISDAATGNPRCGNQPYCDSSTTTPAIIYFPSGNYVVSKPIVMYYYSQLIGDANNLPVLTASASFAGMAVLDADPYNSGGDNWWTNQNNFFRQVRNFRIDLKRLPENVGAGVHWQVAQATSLQNIIFDMHDASDTNEQKGIFMDNGSGGWFSDLTFNGGGYGAFLGSQQFTSRNLTFNNCKTAIYMNWNWGWTLAGVKINGCTKAGLDMSANPANQSVGSVVLADSTITNCPVGVLTSWNMDMVPASASNLVLDNVDMSSNVHVAVSNNQTLLQGNQKISAWATGSGYDTTKGQFQAHRAAGPITPGRKAQSLLDTDGTIYGRSKPQYNDVPVAKFKSVKGDGGCKGDGKTDDTACVQKFLDNTAASNDGSIAYFDHGAYIISNTVTVPSNIRIVGEIWSLIVATGFTDVNNPKPVIQVGKPGETGGSVEISDIIFETKGPNPGAIMIQWNLQSQRGHSGMWDSHVRIGGSYGTELQSDSCTTLQQGNPKPECVGVFLMFYAPKDAAGIYLENTWFWVADHDLDLQSPTQISIYSGRGVLIESQGPTWMWGTASEHSILYNYQFKDARAIFSGFMQTETPYFQPIPQAPTPFKFNSEYDDPTFTVCANSNDPTCKDAWGLRIWNSQEILLYSTGLYSFFNNYKQLCTPEQNCQENMIHIQSSQVDMYAVSTKAAVNMIVDDDIGTVKDADHRSTFAATIAYYFTNH